MRPFGLFQFGTPTTGLGEKLGKPTARLNLAATQAGFFLRFRFGDRKEILRDRLEEFERPFSIDVISGHYILRDRWRTLRDRFGPSKHLKKTLDTGIYQFYHVFSLVDSVSRSSRSRIERVRLAQSGVRDVTFLGMKAIRNR